MEVKVCKNCRRLFNYIYGPELCQDCIIIVSNHDKEQTNKESTVTINELIREDKEKHTKVKDYIMVHPKATIVQISKANEISAAKLLEWIREDRLEFSEDSKDAWFECAKCGKKIKSGRMCYQCKQTRYNNTIY